MISGDVRHAQDLAANIPVPLQQATMHRQKNSSDSLADTPEDQLHAGSRKKRAMKTVRWGMIGCGDVAETKSGPGLYRAKHSMLSAVTCVSPRMTRLFAERHGVPKMFDTTEAMLADPEIDAVYIATPSVWHKSLALAAARAGKHVYIETPMALRFSDCQEISAECSRRQVRLYVAYYRRAMERFVQVREWLDSRAIGDVRSVRIVHHQPPAARDLSSATLPWHLLPDVAGGGKFLDYGLSAFDILDFWFGPVVEVHGIAANRGHFYSVEDTVSAAWRHIDGVVGAGSWCYVCDDRQDLVEIVGSRGRIALEFFSDAPLQLITERGSQEVTITNPLYVQQPFIQSIVNDLNGLGRCSGTPESAARPSWIADEILAEYRDETMKRAFKAS